MALLRHPLIRKKLKIPERIKHPASALPQSDGLIESMKKGWCCEHKSVDKQSRTINLVVVCSTLFPLWLFLCLSVLELVWSAGWKNAQLAHQLEERERRIKNHLDLAAKGQSQSSAHPQRPFGLCQGFFSSLQKNDSLYLEGGRKKTLFEMVAHLYKLWPKYICRLALHLTDWHQTQSIYRSRIHSLLFWRFIHCWPASWSFLSVSYPVRRSACLL